jgi:hypothetical protein
MSNRVLNPGAILPDGSEVPAPTTGGLNQDCNADLTCNNRSLTCTKNNICKLRTNENCISSTDCEYEASNSCRNDFLNVRKKCHKRR